MAVLEPTPTGLAALADEIGLAPRGIFAVTWAFLLRQPVGAIVMVRWLIFGLAGIFAHWHARAHPAPQVAGGPPPRRSGTCRMATPRGPRASATSASPCATWCRTSGGRSW